MVRIRSIVASAALFATIASSLSVYPHQLAYFNELAGGPETGYEHLLGSNLDWGQDLLYAAELVEQRHSSGPVYVSYHSAALASAAIDGARPFPLQLAAKDQGNGQNDHPIFIIGAEQYSEFCNQDPSYAFSYVRNLDHIERVAYSMYVLTVRVKDQQKNN